MAKNAEGVVFFGALYGALYTQQRNQMNTEAAFTLTRTMNVSDKGLMNHCLQCDVCQALKIIYL
jgi:hypothetical protein